MSEKKKPSILVIAANGQDGSYLCEQYLERGYHVYGTIRRHAETETQQSRIEHIRDLINIDYADVNDHISMQRLIRQIKPDLLINTAGQAQVHSSWVIPEYTLQTNGLAVMNLLEAVKSESPTTKFLQCCSSEQFGDSVDTDGFQRETTPFSCLSPYSASKVLAFNFVKIYRNSHNLFASNAITFNHESKRRSSVYVSQKIIKEAVKISLNLSNKLELGSNTYRDWSHAADVCRAFDLILQQDKPDDFVISSMITRSIEDLYKLVFKKLNLDHEKYVVINDKYKRPHELEYLRGDSTKIRNLGWIPQISYDEMIDEMIQHWVNYYKK